MTLTHKILTEAIKPITETALQNNWIDKWFFIRYSDPLFHLRFRLHATNEAAIALVEKAVFANLVPLKQAGYIQEIGTATYNREIDRYSNGFMELSETFFYYDSIAVVNMLNLTDGEERERIRWLWAMKAVNEWLNCFGLSLAEKLALITPLKEAFALEFKVDKSFKFQLDDKYRTYKWQIEAILTEDPEMVEDILPILQLLEAKTAQLKMAMEQARQNQQQPFNSMDLRKLLPDYIHMLINRIIINDPRQHELILYDFLYRYYKSAMARQ